MLRLDVLIFFFGTAMISLFLTFLPSVASTSAP
jgi:hypothetical protein